MPQFEDKDKDKQQATEQKQDQEQKQQLDQQQQVQQPPAKEPGLGVAALQKLLASNARPKAKDVAQVIQQYPEEKSSILEVLQQAPALGNSFVAEVMKEAQGLNLDIKGQRLSYVEGGDDGKNFFVAGAKEKGARWNFGDFSGKADQSGATWKAGDNWSGAVDKKGVVSAERKIADDEKIRLEGGYKDKEVQLKGDYIKGDATLGAGLHGKDLDHFGGDLHGQTKTAGGTSLDGKLSVDKAGDDVTTALGGGVKTDEYNLRANGSYTNQDKWSAGASGEVKVGKDEKVDANLGVQQAGEDRSVSGGLGYQNKQMSLKGSGSYTSDEKWSAGVNGSFAAGKDAKVNANAGLSQQGQDQTLTGGLGYQNKNWGLSGKGSYTDQDNLSLGLSGNRKLGEKTTGSFDLTHGEQKGVSTEALRLGLKDDKNSLGLGLSYTDRENLKGSLDFSSQLNKTSEIKARLETGIQQGKNFTQLGLSGSTKSDDLVLQASLEALKNENGLNIKASGDAVFTLVGEKLYGQAFARLDQTLNDPKYQVGGGVTWTPKDKLALTLAGVVDQDGGFDARLQMDVFKNKVTNARELDEKKKNAALSVFAGYRQGMEGGFMNDRFGAGKFSGQEGQVYFGVGFKF